MKTQCKAAYERSDSIYITRCTVTLCLDGEKARGYCNSCAMLEKFGTKLHFDVKNKRGWKYK